MISVYVKKQGQYPVSAVKIKKFLRDFFKKEGIVSDAFVSVALVGEGKMLELGKKYYPKDSSLHSVFSFVESEVEGFESAPLGGINLGEIIVCYPVAVSQASKEGKLVERKILELLEHSGQHLLGRHHK